MLMNAESLVAVHTHTHTHTHTHGINLIDEKRVDKIYSNKNANIYINRLLFSKQKFWRTWSLLNKGLVVLL